MYVCVYVYMSLSSIFLFPCTTSNYNVQVIPFEYCFYFSLNKCRKYSSKGFYYICKMVLMFKEFNGHFTKTFPPLQK